MPSPFEMALMQQYPGGMRQAPFTRGPQQAANPFAGGTTAFGAQQLPHGQGPALQQGGFGQGMANSRMPFSIPPGGVYGQQKWAGGTGTDIFLPRGSPITANMGGTVVTARGGTGLNQGAEMGIRFDNGQEFRFRHVQPGLQAGMRFSPGQQLAIISDPSMDMLNPMATRGIGAPDGYQHLDLSVGGPFNPAGGAGGSINAAQWLQSVGYQGRVVGRTPGPQEGMGGGMGPFGGGFPGMPGGGGFPGMPGPFGGGGFPGGGMFPGGGGMPNPMMMFGGGGFPGGGMRPPMMPMMPQMPMMPPMGGGFPGGGGFPMPMGGSMMGSMLGPMPFGGFGLGPMSGGLGGGLFR